MKFFPIKRKNEANRLTLISLTPPTSVGRNGDNELLGGILGSLGAGLVVNIDAATAIGARGFQPALGLGVFGGAHHLHGSGDLFDVTRTLQTHLNLLQGGHT